MSTNSASVPMKEFITSIFVNIFFDTVLNDQKFKKKNKDNLNHMKEQIQDAIIL